MGREHGRLAFSLLLSLLIHTLLLSLTFGGQGLGLPGFGFPWRDRRIEVPDLRVVLVPTDVTAAEPAITSVAEPLQQASIEQPVASRPVPTLPRHRAARTSDRSSAGPGRSEGKQNAAADADTAKAPPRRRPPTRRPLRS
jgi:hypothetical protein